MKTIRFKPSFESKLKELRIKTRFINNLKLNKHLFRTWEKSISMREIVEDLNMFIFWHSFIEYAFDWTKTPEGYAYWDMISKHYWLKNEES